MHNECNSLAQSAQGKPASRARQEASTLPTMLAELRRVARPGAGIFVISDFNDFDDACARQLHLLRRHCDIEAIQVFDPLEQQLPAGGLLAFRADDERVLLNTDQRALRDTFKAAQQQAQQALFEAMAAHRIALHSLSTADSAEAQLANWFHPRAVASSRRGGA
ncbi:MAG: hypothetical protein HKO06_00360 [Pseudomonadales bacterium]|nr:hypothetical protein [Pseudomonadales bacterium]